MIKLSQYVIGRLADWGVRHVFMVTGGGAMQLNDSVPMVVIFGHTSLSSAA
jgi:acetolactate synthase-1/2/3 large subunit